MRNDELIRHAEAVLKPWTTSEGRLFGDVGAALISAKGNLHVGACVDVPGWGLCAERSAMAAMVTAGEYVVRKIVAAWRDPKDGALYVLPPCGACREFMRGIDRANLDAQVVVGKDECVTLRDLLPFNEWPASPVS